MNQEEKKLLKQIVDDKYSVGSFCGMIFNSMISQPDWSEQKIEDNISLALKIRLVAERISK